jgi:hypothetical protein
MLIVSHGTIVCSLWVIISVVRLRLGICNRSAVATFWTGLTGCTGFFSRFIVQIPLRAGFHPVNFVNPVEKKVDCVRVLYRVIFA